MAGIYSISGSALIAERQRLNLVAGNIANADSTTSANGTPYRARSAVFSAEPLDGNSQTPTGAEGVRVRQVVTSKAPFKEIYEPGNPKANAKGYVKSSNVSLVRQMSNMIDATRTYQANLSMLQQGESLDRALIKAL